MPPRASRDRLDNPAAPGDGRVAFADGSIVPVITRLVQADENSVRAVTHRVNERGMPSLDPDGPYRDLGGIAS